MGAIVRNKTKHPNIQPKTNFTVKRTNYPSKKTTFPTVLCARAHVSALPANRAERHIPAFPFSSVRDVGVKLPLDS